MRKFIFAFTILVTLSTSIFANTILVRGDREQSDIDSMPSNDVRDTVEIPQDPTEFASQAEYMTPEEQLDYDARYNEKFFEPWTLSGMGLSKGERTWQFMYAKKRMYRRYGERIPKSWFKKQIENSNFKAYESLNRPAIVIRHTDLKLYPTEAEFYYNTNRAGEGFPFDYIKIVRYILILPYWYPILQRWAVGIC